MSLGTPFGLVPVVAQHEPEPDPGRGITITRTADEVIVTITPDLSGFTKERA